jgi:hypothetical protein
MRFVRGLVMLKSLLPPKMISATILLLGASLLSSAARAQAWDVVVNGRAIHLDSSENWNENNLGLGIEREFDEHSRWVKVAVGNAFLDSSDKMSYMAGGGIKRRFLLPQLARNFYVDVGAVGFLMSREDTSSGHIFPGLLPTLTFGTRRVALNVTYLPDTWADQITNLSQADPTVSGIVFLQLKMDATLLGFGRRSSRGSLFAAADRESAMAAVR